MATLNLHDTFPALTLNGGIDLDTDTIKLMLLTNSASPDPDTHDFINDLDTNEVTPGGNYSAGGLTLGSKTVSAITNGAKFDAADATLAQHASNPATVRKAALYKDTGTPATSPIIASGTLAGADIDGTAGDLTVEWHANGIVTVSF
jgi:hypothetical protein